MGYKGTPQRIGPPAKVHDISFKHEMEKTYGTHMNINQWEHNYQRLALQICQLLSIVLGEDVGNGPQPNLKWTQYERGADELYAKKRLTFEVGVQKAKSCRFDLSAGPECRGSSVMIYILHLTCSNFWVFSRDSNQFRPPLILNTCSLPSCAEEHLQSHQRGLYSRALETQKNIEPSKSTPLKWKTDVGTLCKSLAGH